MSIPESHGIVTNGVLVLAWLTYPMNHAVSGLKYMTSFLCERGLFACPAVSVPAAVFQLSTNPEAQREPGGWQIP